MLRISENGLIKYRTTISSSANQYIQSITTNNQLKKEFVTPKFIDFLKKRNKNIPEKFYSKINYS